jgi:aminopeptidase N
VYLGYRVGHIRSNGRAFRAIIYNKGAMVLHMLRQLVGDEVFFRGLKRFYLGARFRKVGSEDFRVAMEIESNRSLARFFERWIYSAGVPQVAFTYRVEPGASGQTAVLRFEQAGTVYDLPVTVTLDYATGASVDVVVPVVDQVTEVSVPLTGTLRTASISRNDSSLGEFRTGTK